jgi:hypothetical protein
VVIPGNSKLGYESAVLSRGETRKTMPPIDRKRYLVIFQLTLFIMIRTPRYRTSTSRVE